MLQDQQIGCPHCHKKFPLSEAMRHELEESIKTDYDQRLVAVNEAHEAELENARKDAETKGRLKVEAEKKLQVEDLLSQVQELETKEAEFTSKELVYLKREREIKNREGQIELEKQQFINEKSEELSETLREQIEGEMQGKLSEKDLKIKRLENIAAELQRKARQGSTEEQGEAFEQELETHLREAFRFDDFENVVKGKRGADINQRVKTSSQKCCGTIVWEAKFTDSWKEDWVSKLKVDQAAIDGHTVGIIVSRVLPKSIKHFGLHNGVWVSDFFCAIGLATAIRSKFEELHQSKAANEGKATIEGLVYDYLVGQEFTRRIIASGESLRDMKGDIDKERSAMEKNWTRREKQLFRVANNIAGIYGDLSGLGASLQSVPILELESGKIEQETI